jgi:hypothetical protein
VPLLLTTGSASAAAAAAAGEDIFLSLVAYKLTCVMPRIMPGGWPEPTAAAMQYLQDDKEVRRTLLLQLLVLLLLRSVSAAAQLSLKCQPPKCNGQCLLSAFVVPRCLLI